MIAVPAFDVEACRQIADMHPYPPTDPDELRRIWKHLIDDHLAACDQIETLTYALAQRTAA